MLHNVFIFNISHYLNDNKMLRWLLCVMVVKQLMLTRVTLRVTLMMLCQICCARGGRINPDIDSIKSNDSQ